MSENEITITDHHRKIAGVIANRVEQTVREGLDALGITNPVNHNWHALDKLLAKAFPDNSERLEYLEWCLANVNQGICQTLGKALGAPWFKDDQKNFPGSTEADGVCVGEHIAETLAECAAQTIAALEGLYRDERASTAATDEPYRSQHDAETEANIAAAKCPTQQSNPVPVSDIPTT